MEGWIDVCKGCVYRLLCKLNNIKQCKQTLQYSLIFLTYFPSNQPNHTVCSALVVFSSKNIQIQPSPPPPQRLYYFQEILNIISYTILYSVLTTTCTLYNEQQRVNGGKWNEKVLILIKILTLIRVEYTSPKGSACEYQQGVYRDWQNSNQVKIILNQISEYRALCL